jgi:hypothetical protein
VNKITTVAVPAAVLIAAVAGCSSSAAPEPHTASASASTSAAAAQTCHQLYQAWKTGPEKAIVDGPLKTDLKHVQGAGANDDLSAMRKALISIGRDAKALRANPIPACADPKGYWPRFLSLLQASGDNARTASGLFGLVAAEAPLKKIVPVENKLSAELKATGAR